MLWQGMTLQNETSQTKQREMPSEAGPLGVYKGARPPAPDWFEGAISARYETHYIERDGYKIHYQCWGDASKPGLLLTHGNGAHAHWWDFTAPYFLDDYYVVALTLSGMGDSGWRDNYDMDGFSKDQLAVAEATGLFDHAQKPLLVAHSFGGFVTLHTAAKHSARFGGVVIVDSPVHPPEHNHSGPPRGARANKVYPTLEAALARFRLAPPQPCENHYAMDYIARYSLKEVATEEVEAGWVWKFDPSIWRRFDMSGRPPHEMVQQVSCPLAFMRGTDSDVVPDDVWDYMQSSMGRQVPFVSIPHAYHHVMLDQPLAFITGLRALLSGFFRPSA